MAPFPRLCDTRKTMGARTLALTAVLAAFIAAAPDASAPAPASAASSSPARVIAFGDSLVSGKGATKGHDFVSVLSNLVGVDIVNAGRSGDTSALACPPDALRFGPSDDYELLLAIAPEARSACEAAAARAGVPFTVIGQCVSDTQARTITDRAARERALPRSGFDHFRGA